MTQFAQVKSFSFDEEGKKVEVDENTPIIEIKKLNGQGSIYKAIDADYESINVQREVTGSKAWKPLDVRSFTRSIRSQFGTGTYDASALSHVQLPQLEGMGQIRIELHAKINLEEDSYSFTPIDEADPMLFLRGNNSQSPICLRIESWLNIVRQECEKGMVHKPYLEMAEEIQRNVPKLVEKTFMGKDFDPVEFDFDKISVGRKRVYD